MAQQQVGIALVLAVLTAAAVQVSAQGVHTSYSKMAPVDQYLIPSRDSEIALARSAAPPAISNGAEVMVLSRQGFEVAVPGTNHFVCMVERSWNAGIGDPEFWNPKIRGPICFNPAGARSYVPISLMKTRLALEGKSQAEIAEAIQAAFAQKKLPELEPGAMCYMMSKEGWLNDRARNWHPHVMFFVPIAMAKSWGANLAGSPVLADDDRSDRLTVMMVPVAHWSDGTQDANPPS